AEPTTDAVDDKKARVAAAVAKAKAKKLAQVGQTDNTAVEAEPTTDAVDDKKARIAAAVAKAKAKKMVQASQIDIGEAASQPTVSVESTADIAPDAALTVTADSADLSPEQIKKAKVAAAVAKAKAKQLAKRAEQEEQ
ncbi:electron transport complex subunit RsxC, partial [Shewanella algicola]|nr:electron transport complex subunit RsxC [Shewanella algicola]